MIRTKKAGMRRTVYTTEDFSNKPPVKIPIPPQIRNGRPPVFNSVEELQRLIADYFESCWTTKIVTTVNIKGEFIREEIPVQTEPYCVTGLACWLGITRTTLLQYQHEKEQFTATIKTAKSFIEHHAEKLLLKGKVPAVGVIFSIANNFHGWKDVRRTELTGPDGEKINPFVGVGLVTNDARAQKTREDMLKQFSGEDTVL